MITRCILAIILIGCESEITEHDGADFSALVDLAEEQDLHPIRCSIDLDCEYARVCEASYCQAKPCTGNSDCGSLRRCISYPTNLCTGRN